MTGEDRAILITGASRGLGHALVEACSSRGWKTVPLVRDAQVAERIHTEFPNCCPIIGDVTSNEVETVITQGLRRIGRLHVLINNAGVPGRTTVIDSVTPAEIADLFQTHCLGALRCTKAVLPFMQNGQRVIVNVTSRFGSVGRWASGTFAGRSISYSYRIAKASQNMLTVSLAGELGPRGFIVCAVHPGRLKTQSGASDADTEPETAAHRLAEWIDGIDAGMNGKCFDLENAEVMEW
jgi:NAD(P)-dependent dehydrogenase (short-subunit alcohol dehydrogenase family)